MAFKDSLESSPQWPHLNKDEHFWGVRNSFQRTSGHVNTLSLVLCKKLYVFKNLELLNSGEREEMGLGDQGITLHCNSGFTTKQLKCWSWHGSLKMPDSALVNQQWISSRCTLEDQLVMWDGPCSNFSSAWCFVTQESPPASVQHRALLVSEVFAQHVGFTLVRWVAPYIPVQSLLSSLLLKTSVHTTCFTSHTLSWFQRLATEARLFWCISACVVRFCRTLNRHALVCVPWRQPFLYRYSKAAVNQGMHFYSSTLGPLKSAILPKILLKSLEHGILQFRGKPAVYIDQLQQVAASSSLGIS